MCPVYIETVKYLEKYEWYEKGENIIIAIIWPYIDLETSFEQFYEIYNL